MAPPNTLGKLPILFPEIQKTQCLVFIGFFDTEDFHLKRESANMLNFSKIYDYEQKNYNPRNESVF